MQDARSFAYSLCQCEEGWRWRVFDEEGVTVAGGADPCRAAAQAAVEVLLQRGPAAEPRSFAERPIAQLVRARRAAAHQNNLRCNIREDLKV
jgi:hypothetical protein